MKDINLLVVTTAYPQGSSINGIFIKNQLDAVRDRLETVSVVSPVAYFPRTILKFASFREYSGHTEYPADYSYGNVRVYRPRYLWIWERPHTVSLREDIYFRVLERIIERKNIDFDIIHSHFIFPSSCASTRIKMRTRKPLIITAHGGEIYGIGFANVNMVDKTKKTLLSADAIITTSPQNREIMINKLGIDEQKISIQASGFNPDIFHPRDKLQIRKELQLPESKRIILSIGHLLEVKGHRYLIDAMRKIAGIDEDIFCLIIGNGILKNDLRKQIKDLGLGERIRLIDAVEHQDVPLWINASDLFVLPSLNEGSPTIVAEALGCGKPVVATKVGNVPFLIKEGFNGIITDVQSTNALADGIMRALQIKWDQEAISHDARTRFSWPSIADDTLRVYESVM